MNQTTLTVLARNRVPRQFLHDNDWMTPGIYELKVPTLDVQPRQVLRSFLDRNPIVRPQDFDLFVAKSDTGEIIARDADAVAGLPDVAVRKLTDRVPYFYRVKVDAATPEGDVQPVGEVETYADNKLRVKHRALGILWNAGLDAKRCVPRFDIECVMPNGAEKN